MNGKNTYFPCLLVQHENYYSIILSNFHYFDDHFAEKEIGGYTIEQLAKQLVKKNKIKGIKYDSEAGMFCAYSDSSENLLQLCGLFKEITGDENQHSTKEVKPLISLDKAEKLLLKGFVKSLDKKAQEEFLKNVPMPSLSKKQTEYLNNIQYGTDEEKIYSAKRINSEARTITRQWENYLSHPTTITILLEAIDRIENPKVYTELLDAIVFICDRHLPDLRTQPYFLKALKSKIARNRQVAIWGLENIYDYPFEDVLPLMSDKSYLVRVAILKLIKRKDFEFASWMFDPVQSRINKRPKDFSIFFPLFNDKNRKVRLEALDVILRLEKNELFSELKGLISIYREHMKNEDIDYFKSKYIEVIERIERIK